MHDIKYIRENPDAFDAAMKRRGLEKSHVEQILEHDSKWKRVQASAEELQKEKKAADKRIGIARSKGQDVTIDFERQKKMSAEIDKMYRNAGEFEQQRNRLLSMLPNIAASDVPLGNDENDNRQIRVVGDKPSVSDAKEHYDLGEQLGQMDFETAANMSGARFVLLSAGLARMERALASFMLDIHTSEFGYTEVVPPFLVRNNALYGTGQLPKFEEDLFKTTTDHYLIPTAEVPLTNIVAGQILDEEYLPRRYTAYTPCFRSEAGSAGKDTRGMIRQHQFSKVELVSVVHPDKSKEEHERMTECAEEILKRLGLHYRTMLLCTGDMGFGAQKTYDIEVWLPGQNTYREISSCSNCGDFQARRMKARFRKKGEKQTHFLHTLNGSGLAIGRTMIAVMENYQQADGSIKIPEALVPYMGGLTKIEKH